MLLVASLFVANTINIGADIAAMGASAKLMIAARTFPTKLRLQAYPI